MSFDLRRTATTLDSARRPADRSARECRRRAWQRAATRRSRWHRACWAAVAPSSSFTFTFFGCTNFGGRRVGDGDDGHRHHVDSTDRFVTLASSRVKSKRALVSDSSVVINTRLVAALRALATAPRSFSRLLSCQSRLVLPSPRLSSSQSARRRPPARSPEARLIAATLVARASFNATAEIGAARRQAARATVDSGCDQTISTLCIPSGVASCRQSSSRRRPLSLVCCLVVASSSFCLL